MKEFNELDELFKKGLENASLTPPPGVWESVASSAAASASVSVGSAAWLLPLKWVAGSLIVATVSYFTWTALNPADSGKDSETTSAVISEKRNSEIISGKKAESPVSGKENDRLNSELKIPADRIIQQPDFAPEVNVNTQENSGVSESGLPPYSPQKPEITTGDKPATSPQKQPHQNPIVSGNTNCPHVLAIQVTKIADNQWNLFLENAFGNSVWDIGDGKGYSHTGTSVLYHAGEHVSGDVKIKARSISENGCTDSTNTMLRVQPGEPDIWDVFTPNGDGYNDIYLPVFKSRPAFFDLSIYDLNNRTVFHSDNPQIGWTGNINGTPGQNGRYRLVLVYKLTPDSKAKTVSKYIELLR